jgi:hypothetical protein
VSEPVVSGVKTKQPAANSQHNMIKNIPKKIFKKNRK